MQATLIDSREIAPGVRHFVFEARGVERFAFTPGQFVSFSGNIEGHLITRAYSIASAPCADDAAALNRFELCLNRVEGGIFSPHLFQLAPGDSVEMAPPLGTFVLREPLRDSLMIATGTGIAPFRSMLPAALRTGGPSITLLFGVRHESHLLYRIEFEAMAREFPQFRFWPTLTQPESGWSGRAGRVQAHLIEAIDSTCNTPSNLDIYLCGLKPMVDDVRRILKDMGFNRKQIRYEKYD
jgi:CDP-4-dehydro-6-deoxyglucose reductase